MSGPSRFEQQKAWADGHINEVNRVVRKVAGKIIDILETDPERDRKEGIDYEVKVASGNIACRIRRAHYPHRDLTITISKPSGVKPEVDKILNGSVRWYLYAWAAEGRFVEWMFVDLDKVRELRLIEKAIERGRTQTDSEGSRFVCIPFEELEQRDVIVACEISADGMRRRRRRAG
jgi:hypothetical protein